MLLHWDFAPHHLASAAPAAFRAQQEAFNWPEIWRLMYVKGRHCVCVIVAAIRWLDQRRGGCMGTGGKEDQICLDGETPGAGTLNPGHQGLLSRDTHTQQRPLPSLLYNAGIYITKHLRHPSTYLIRKEEKHIKEQRKPWRRKRGKRIIESSFNEEQNQRSDGQRWRKVLLGEVFGRLKTCD